MKKYCIPDEQIRTIERSMMPFAIYQLVENRVVTLALSGGFCKLFGYDDISEAYHDMDNDMYKDTHHDDAARIADAAFKFATDKGDYDVVYRSKNKKGGYNIIHAQGEHISTVTGERIAQVWYTNEGTYNDEHDTQVQLGNRMKNALYEESFLKASYYDYLTGLPSMTYFFELSVKKRDAIISEGGKSAVMFMDFSGIKYFNHKYGFAEGDELLREFARILAGYFGNENCCRLGQDHFAIVAQTDGIEDTLDSLFEDCCKLNDGNSLPLHVGIYLNWAEGTIASVACDRAKFACDTLKNEYTSSYSYYDMSMKSAEEKQQYVIANIDKAIKEKWITVYYQPIVRAVNGRVCDEEALARWIDPQVGFMSPADFISVLEEHKLIYKLDLYIVDCVMEKIKNLSEAGFHIVPQSINLSRSDFDTCDIVEEIRRRVDGAGVNRSLISIEITESIVGKDFEFITKQIERFRELGFAVWMDDFGSGYSSLDVLQDIKFDLMKFDMRFMHNFNQNDRSRIILTEMIKMANALGIETICEGVETKEQVQFLQEAGCSKLQGYYFCKPIPVEQIFERYKKGEQIGFENPKESDYYESVGRVNLYDLSIIAQNNSGEFNNFFNTLPMSIIEINDGKVRFSRSNQSYRDFMERHFGFRINNKVGPFQDKAESMLSPFMQALVKSSKENGNLYVDEKLPSGAIAHSCLHRLGMNPVTGTTAIAVAVLSVSGSERGTSYASIARALAADYFNLFYVNINDDTFFEYTTKDGADELAIERHDTDFFRKSREDALKRLYHEDHDKFMKVFTKENILREIDECGFFSVSYRLIINDEPIYVHLKTMRMQDDPGHIIIGISNVDQHMKQKEMLERIQRNELAYSRIMALSDNFLCIYTIDAKTDEYEEYRAAAQYESLGLAKNGTKFFQKALENSLNTLPENDRKMFMKQFTKENVLNRIREKGVFTIGYHVIIAGEAIPVFLRAVLVNEDSGEKVIIGVYRLDVGNR